MTEIQCRLYKSSQQVHKQSPDRGRKYHSDIFGGSVPLTLEPLAFSTACLAAILHPILDFKSTKNFYPIPD